MNLKYKVSEAEYDQYLRERRKRELEKPLNRFFTVVLALMPLAVLLFAAAAKLMEGKSLMLLAVVTIGLSICNVLVRTRYWGRSDKVLSAIRSRNGITDDFWLEHRLRVDEQGFRLICGEHKAEYQWNCFGGFEEIDDMLIPIFNASPADIIPAGAIAAFGGKEALIEAFIAPAKAAARRAQDMTPPKNILLRLDYQYEKEDYLRDLRDGQRKKYTTKLIFDRAFYAKLTITAVLIYAAVVASSPAMLALYIFLILLCNYEHISIFTPLLLRRLRKNIRAIMVLRPGRGASLYLTPAGISIRGDIHAMDLPYREILAVRRTAHAAVLYLASQTMLTVPAPPATEQKDFDAFVEAVCKKIRA